MIDASIYKTAAPRETAAFLERLINVLIYLLTDLLTEVQLWLPSIPVEQ